MNSENFFKKLRNVIREEIEYALDKKMTKPIVSKTSQAKEIQHGIKLYAEQTQKPVTNKTISKNSKFSSIQDILNETRKTLNESVEMDKEFSFTADMAENFGHGNQNAAIPHGFTSKEVPDDVMAALTKDYSALMKKIDEKKGR